MTMWLRRGLREYFWGYFFIVPSVAAFILFAVYPLVDTIVLSFQDTVVGRTVWVGFSNYQNIFNDPVFTTALGNTFYYWLGMVPVGTVLAVSLAALIVRIPSLHWQNFLKAALYLPVVGSSSVILAIIWQYLYEPDFGLINYLLHLVGLPTFMWLGDYHLALPSLVIMMHTQWWGGMIILLAASMTGIPRDLYDAASVDGATELRQFLSITLPLLRPAVTYVAIIATISSFRIFNEIFLMTSGGPDYATINVSYDIYVTGLSGFHFGLASAQAVVLLAVTALLSIGLYKTTNLSIEY